MSAYGCAELRDAAAELALGVLGGAERAEALIHLNDCSRCQALVAELTEAADTIPLMVREAEPPAGFEARTVAGMASDRRRSRRRWVASLAATAAAAAILSIVIVRVVDARNPVPPAEPEAAATLVQARMVSEATGAPAGWAYVAGGRSVALVVDYGVDAGTYDIRVTPAQGDAVVIGDITVTENRGSWTGESRVGIDSGSEIALVDTRGARVCRGRVEGGG